MSLLLVAFDRAGGFDAARFDRSLFDADYCRRLAGLGDRTVHVGAAGLVADPDAFARRDRPTEVARFRAAHGAGPDPFANKNLSRWADFAPAALPDWVRPAARPGPVRALFVTHNLAAGEGAPKVLADVAVGLAGRGAVTAEVYAPGPTGPGAAAFAAAGLPVTAADPPHADLFVTGRWTPKTYAAAVADFARCLRRTRPEVVVVNTLGLFPLVDAAARAGVPAVWVVHESYTPGRLAATLTPFARGRVERAFGWAARVVFVSKSCADLYARYDGRKNFTVITNAILDPAPVVSHGDSRPAVGARPGVTRFVAVGTVCERKGQHTFVEAAGIVARTRRDFVVSLVGTRPGLTYLSYVGHLARARGVADLVELVPETPAVAAHLRAADVFVCASHVEAYSLAVLEAMAAGLPVVSTPCGGLDEQVTWGRNALKFGFDDAAGLAGHMLTLLADPGRRADLAAESRAGFELLPGPAAVLDEYERLIRLAAGGGP